MANFATPRRSDSISTVCNAHVARRHNDCSGSRTRGNRDMPDVRCGFASCRSSHKLVPNKMRCSNSSATLRPPKCPEKHAPSDHPCLCSAACGTNRAFFALHQLGQKSGVKRTYQLNISVWALGRADPRGGLSAAWRATRGWRRSATCPYPSCRSWEGRRTGYLHCWVARIWVPGTGRTCNGRKDRQHEHG
jgi:hypothetical protein